MKHCRIGFPLLILLAICTGFSTSYAQNCAKVNSWIERAASYTMGIDLNILGEYGIMKYTSAAFHYDHFKPVFGKNYADLSDNGIVPT